MLRNSAGIIPDAFHVVGLLSTGDIGSLLAVIVLIYLRCVFIMPPVWSLQDNEDRYS